MFDLKKRDGEIAAAHEALSVAIRHLNTATTHGDDLDRPAAALRCPRTTIRARRNPFVARLYQAEGANNVNEWALLKDGQIVNVIMTSRMQSEVQGMYPNHDVADLYSLPTSVQQNYQYWSQRP